MKCRYIVKRTVRMGGEMYTVVFNGGAVEIKVGSGEAILSKRG